MEYTATPDYNILHKILDIIRLKTPNHHSEHSYKLFIINTPIYAQR